MRYMDNYIISNFKEEGMKYSRMTILVLVILMSVVVLPFDVSAKLKTKSGTTKTFAFISTDGEVCSAKVYSTIGQNYTVSGNNATYTKRTYWVGLSYVATYTTPQIISITAKYINNSGNTVKTFSWTKDTSSSLLPGDVKVSIKKKNSTSVTYKKNNTNYFYLGYNVGNSEYMISPVQGYNFKMSLKIS